MKYPDGTEVVLRCPECDRRMYVGINLNIENRPRYFADCPSSECPFMGYKADTLEALAPTKSDCGAL